VIDCLESRCPLSWEGSSALWLLQQMIKVLKETYCEI
jgi:hypothetical protein